MAQTPYVSQEQKEFERFYKLSSLWIKYRPKLKRLGIIALIVFNVSTIGWASWRFIDYVLIDFFSERAMIASIITGVDTLRNISESRAAESLGAGEVDVFSIGDDRVDFYVELTNPNDDWYASFTYYFRYGSQETDARDGFILPGQVNKPLSELAVKISSIPTTASFTIEDVKWIRVNQHAIPDYAEWEQDRLDFKFTGVVFEREVEGADFGRITFQAENSNPFGYWSPVFTIVMLRSGNIVGATTTVIPSFESGESREVIVNLFGTVPNANEVRIVPDIDIFDPDVFMPIEGERQPDVRERIDTGRR